MKSVHLAKEPNWEKLPANWCKWQPYINLYLFCCKNGIVQFNSNLWRASLNSKVILYHWPDRVYCRIREVYTLMFQHGSNITFPPERGWTFLKVRTALPGFSVRNWMVHHDTTECLRHPLLEILIWMFWKRAENFLLHLGEFSFFTCFTRTFMLGWHQRSPDKPIGNERLNSSVGLL